MAESKARSSGTHIASYLPNFRKDRFHVFFGAPTEAVYADDLSAWTIAYRNKSAENLFGYSNKEALGQTIQLLHADPAVFGRTLKMLAPAIQGKGYWRGRLEYQSGDGHQLPAKVVAFRPSQIETGIIYIVVIPNTRRLKAKKDAGGRRKVTRGRKHDSAPRGHRRTHRKLEQRGGTYQRHRSEEIIGQHEQKPS